MSMQDAADKILGEKVISKFYSHWKNYPAAKGISLPQLITILKGRRPMGGEAFIIGLGSSVRETGISDSRIESAMKNLSVAANGKLPSQNGNFFQAMNSGVTQFSYVDAFAYTFVESAKDIGSGVQSVGGQLIFAGKIINFLLPVIVLAFVYFYLDEKSGGKITKAVKAMK